MEDNDGLQTTNSFFKLLKTSTALQIFLGILLIVVIVVIALAAAGVFNPKAGNIVPITAEPTTPVPTTTAPATTTIPATTTLPPVTTVPPITTPVPKKAITVYAVNTSPGVALGPRNVSNTRCAMQASMLGLVCEQALSLLSYATPDTIQLMPQTYGFDPSRPMQVYNGLSFATSWNNAINNGILTRDLTTAGLTNVPNTDPLTMFATGFNGTANCTNFTSVLAAASSSMGNLTSTTIQWVNNPVLTTCNLVQDHLCLCI